MFCSSSLLKQNTSAHMHPCSVHHASTTCMRTGVQGTIQHFQQVQQHKLYNGDNASTAAASLLACCHLCLFVGSALHGRDIVMHPETGQSLIYPFILAGLHCGVVHLETAKVWYPNILGSFGVLHFRNNRTCCQAVWYGPTIIQDHVESIIETFPV